MNSETITKTNEAAFSAVNTAATTNSEAAINTINSETAISIVNSEVNINTVNSAAVSALSTVK